MKLLSSYFFRLAALVAILPVLVMAAALYWSYVSTAEQLRAERGHQINDDIAALVEVYTDSGRGGLVRAIDNRLLLTPKTRARAHYALVDADGIKLAGDLNAASLGGQDYTQLASLKNTDNTPLIMRSTPLRGGEILHVARNDEIRQNTLARLRAVFSWMVLATLIAGFFAGLLAARIFKRRLKMVNETCAQVSDGHLGARVAGSQNGDEFGVLSGNVNAMLERIGKLISLRKHITDQVAHELRSPLARLDAKLIKAAETCADPSEIEGARSEITNCISLLDALLDVSSLEAQGGDKSGFDTVNLSELAAQMAEFYQGLAEEKRIDLSIDITPDILLEGDAMQLSRLITNLIDNAIKYTQVGGNIKLSVGAGPVLTVSDNGLGVPQKYRTSIFTPFFRAPGLVKSEQPNVQGHGLGLALCQAIAKRHNMKLQAEDAKPGTRMVLS